MRQLEFAEKFDRGICEMTSYVFMVYYGTDWYESKIKPHLMDYISSPTADKMISSVYRSFLSKNSALTAADPEVFLNLIYKEYDGEFTKCVPQHVLTAKRNISFNARMHTETILNLNG